MDMLLEGKRALITGSTSGIGAQCARVLAGEGVVLQPYRLTARSWLDRWPQLRLAVLVRLLPTQCGNSNRWKAKK